MSLKAVASASASASTSNMVYDTFSATAELNLSSGMLNLGCFPAPPMASTQPPPAAGCIAEQGRRKRRRQPRRCRNKAEVETQRMTHIAVERNRRRLMNEHLAMLRSLMPESYIQRGDQASIVGGAIEFVKELEHRLQSMEAQKRTFDQTQQSIGCINHSEICVIKAEDKAEFPPFARFFTYPQYSWCHHSREYPQTPGIRRSAVADIEVNLIDTHASLRILSPRRPRQLSQMVAGLQALFFSILHLSVTSLEAVVLYSVSIKVEEGCRLTTVEEIAAAVHRIITLVEAATVAGGQVFQDELIGST
ncbi:hypothetical protein HPP92_001551 [Vanilla planifolia]|uniref:BHLH domain-containing protein n=1 Tax=Vanilla planifolia TaxID=51239 RepID=A0A835RY86_VANPL|nr:hypothetical protein HPP92_001551 [Vanilla planifolia]